MREVPEDSAELSLVWDAANMRDYDRNGTALSAL